MPFIRHTRDKRGYETTYVMHAYRPAPGPQRTRVLYLFRSPSHIRLGRRALDDEAREALEHTHPDVSFDWTVLGRESMSPPRPEGPRERPQKGRRPGQPAPAVPPKPVPVVLEDHTPLGRVLGAEQAGRLRARYAEILHRVLRRARTPEDRDRLTDRAQRLNPDDWHDEESIRAGIAQADAEWETILAELPSRRRGRRGGRKRGEGEPSSAETAGDRHVPPSASRDLSGIIEEPESGGIDDEGPEVMAEDDGGSPAGAPADRSGVWTGSTPDVPGDS